MQIKVLDARIFDWGLPQYQSAGAAGVDLFACMDAPVQVLAQAPAILIASGIALNFGDLALAGLVLPRSGLGHKKGLVLGNSLGLIDPDYTGEVLISLWNRNPPGSAPIDIRPGDRIAQLVFVPILRPEFEVVRAFSQTGARGAGGFGSTGG
ncbi:deoxyuridine 5'-triphosphate nucleotidohydrolase [Pseudorhodobacter antarcticus]|jgi:dUTP pyrophosphatase|uniref:dUTP diphosphatase n=1 Tax=Pseudorhodobacter antarcticus TaxID=1077947 RepID=A0A1H8B2A1_9RHOB|nr:dUTP diphosphatase [Pseudorhodobacter antarcticus]SEM76224.1 deoxyuridine 5'-triphosphate nucleotidohydrolase [Pseudorhodobacter antarcticus]